MPSIRMPAGKYYIGDPCYVINEWDEFLSPMWDADGESAFLWKGYECVVFHTAYGDGVYDLNGFDIGVDSGCIGALPVEACSGNADRDGVIVTFKQDWLAETDGETLRFGANVIKTGDDDEHHGDYCEHCGR